MHCEYAPAILTPSLSLQFRRFTGVGREIAEPHSHIHHKNEDWTWLSPSSQLGNWNRFYCSISSKLNWGGGGLYKIVMDNPLPWRPHHIWTPAAHSHTPFLLSSSSPRRSLTDAETFGSRQRDAETVWECVVVRVKEREEERIARMCMPGLSTFSRAACSCFSYRFHLEPSVLFQWVFTSLHQHNLLKRDFQNLQAQIWLALNIAKDISKSPENLEWPKTAGWERHAFKLFFEPSLNYLYSLYTCSVRG